MEAATRCAAVHNELCLPSFLSVSACYGAAVCVLSCCPRVLWVGLRPSVSAVMVLLVAVVRAAAAAMLQVLRGPGTACEPAGHPPAPLLDAAAVMRQTLPTTWRRLLLSGMGRPDQPRPAGTRLWLQKHLLGPVRGEELAAGVPGDGGALLPHVVDLLFDPLLPYSYPRCTRAWRVREGYQSGTPRPAKATQRERERD